MKASKLNGVLGALIALTVVAVSACGSSSASTRSNTSTGPTTTAAPVTAPETIPPGTVLRVGDQFDQLAIALELAGEDQDYPYTVEYSSFLGGPSMLQAFQAGAIDTGIVGSTPLIFAQAAGQDIVGVAGLISERGHYGLVVGPDKDVDGWEDLKGKKVAYQRGTAGQAFLLQALEKVGLTFNDVESVDLPQTQIAQAISAGQADVGISVEPLTSSIIASTPGAKVITTEQEPTDRSSFLIASKVTLADEGKTAALADFASRVIRAYTFLQDKPELVADAVYVKVFGLTPERAAELAAESGGSQLLELPGGIVDSQQHLADLYFEAGEIPAELDVSAQFDNRFEQLLRSIVES